MIWDYRDEAHSGILPRNSICRSQELLRRNKEHLVCQWHGFPQGKHHLYKSDARHRSTPHALTWAFRSADRGLCAVLPAGLGALAAGVKGSTPALGQCAGGQWWQQVTGSGWQARCPQRHHPAQAPRPAGTVLALLGVRSTTECN